MAFWRYCYRSCGAFLPPLFLTPDVALVVFRFCSLSRLSRVLYVFLLGTSSGLCCVSVFSGPSCFPALLFLAFVCKCWDLPPCCAFALSPPACFVCAPYFFGVIPSVLMFLIVLGIDCAFCSSLCFSAALLAVFGFFCVLTFGCFCFVSLVFSLPGRPFLC